MEFLIKVSELWNEFLISGFVSCALVFVLMAMATILAKKKKKTSATIVTLIAFLCGDVFRITTIISLILFLLKIVLNFI